MFLLCFEQESTNDQQHIDHFLIKHVFVFRMFSVFEMGDDDDDERMNNDGNNAVRVLTTRGA